MNILARNLDSLAIAAIILSLVFVLISSWRIGHNRDANSLGADEQLALVQPQSSLVANAIYQQDVDHFSNDHRAMSPRSWGNLDAEDNNTPRLAPAIGFTPAPNSRQSNNSDRISPVTRQPYSQVDSSRVHDPSKFFESRPLNPKPGFRNSSSFSSPVPRDNLTLQDQPNSDSDQVDEQEAVSIVEEQSAEPDNGEPSESKNVEKSQSTPLASVDGSDLEDSMYWYEYNGSQFDAFPQMDFLSGPDCCQPDQIETGNICLRCGKPRGVRGRLRNSRSPWNRNARNSRRSSESTSSCGQGYDCVSCCDVEYNPNLGHRYESPISRGFIGSSSEEFSFEEDEQFPPMSEILAQSVFFGEVSYQFIQPAFQGNSAVTINSPGSGISRPYNFDLESGFKVMGGFESDYGPGFAGEYFQFDNNSDVISFTSDGVSTGESRVYQLGPNTWTSIIADDPGEVINTFHSLETHSTSVYAFKAIKFKRAWVNGRFGIQIVNVDQKMRANLYDAGGLIGSLNSTSHLSAFGPKFGIDYIRRIGHTPAQLISSTSTSLLFGDREQVVDNTYTNTFSSVGADEFVAVLDVFFGVQVKRYRGEKRNTTARLGFVNQTWLNGGTAIDPNGDFGFQGISIMLGLNR